MGKIICSKHEQAYDAGSQCPWCIGPERATEPAVAVDGHEFLLERGPTWVIGSPRPVRAHVVTTKPAELVRLTMTISAAAPDRDYWLFACEAPFLPAVGSRFPQLTSDYPRLVHHHHGLPTSDMFVPSSPMHITGLSVGLSLNEHAYVPAGNHLSCIAIVR